MYMKSNYFSLKLHNILT